MKQTLLLFILGLTAITTRAQVQLDAEPSASPLLLQGQFSELFAPAAKALKPRAAADGPTAYYSRPEGLLFFGISYRGIQARSYAFAPAGVDITYHGSAQGEAVEWEYDTEYNEDGTALTVEKKTYTADDTTLVVNYVDGGYYAPLLRATAEGRDSVYAIVPARIWTNCSTGEIFGSGSEMYDIPVGNYNGRYFGMVDNVFKYAATNNATSDAALAAGFGISTAHVSGFWETIPMTSGVNFALYGADAIVYAEEAPTTSDIEIEVYESYDGEIMDDEPLTVLKALAVNRLNYSNGTLQGYGIRFGAPKSLLGNGELTLHFVNAEGSTASFSPCTVVSADPDRTVYASFDLEYTAGAQSGTMRYPINILNYTAPYHITGLATGLIMSYYPYDVQEIINGENQEDPSGITAPQGLRTSAATYDLQGREIGAPLKGVYIKNGKKFVK